MVVKKVTPTTSVINSQPKSISMVEEKQLVDNIKEVELPVHPALAQVPDGVNVQDDFERVVFNHAQVPADLPLAELDKVAVHGRIIKEIDKPSVALRCKFCHTRAQFRLYDTNLFNNVLVCEADARKQLFPEPVVVEEKKEEVADGNSTDTASTDGAVGTGSETGTVEVSEGKSDNGQAGEAPSNTP